MESGTCHFDVVILGTGICECVIGCLLSMEGYKILQVEEGEFYGGFGASVNLQQCYKYFNQTDMNEIPDQKDWCIDLVPKFVYAAGDLVKMLLCTDVTKYFEWEVISDSYVYKPEEGGWFTEQRSVHKVPSTELDTLRATMLSLLEKNRLRLFLKFCYKYNPADKASKFAPDTPMALIANKFGLEPFTLEFVSHCMANIPTEEYLLMPLREFAPLIKLYMDSYLIYGESPFIYPAYGLGGLAEGFARYTAIHGGVFALSQPVEKMEFKNDKISEVHFKSDQNNGFYKSVTCDHVVSNAQFLGTDKKTLTKKIYRAVLIYNRVPKTMSDSFRLIIPYSQVDRENDIYVSFLSNRQAVTPEGYYLAIVSTVVEKKDPREEMGVIYEILGTPLKKFDQIVDYYVPDPTQTSNLYVLSSVDETNTFKNEMDKVHEIYEAITKKELRLNEMLQRKSEDDSSTVSSF